MKNLKECRNKIDEIDNKIAGANVDNYQITEFSLANNYLNLI